MSRRTAQREAILQVVRETTSHPTAESIYQQARATIPEISLGTVYRNLNNLHHEGIISALRLAADETRFDGNPTNHYHFRCESCGNVYDVDIPIDDTLNRRLADQTGFIVYNHILEFRGHCHSCAGSPITTNGTATSEAANQAPTKL